MSKPIRFRYIPATGNPGDGTYRTGFWQHPESGVEIRKGLDVDGVTWDIWTAGMGKGIGSGQTLTGAKDRARFIITDRKEWLA